MFFLFYLLFIVINAIKGAFNFCCIYRLTFLIVCNVFVFVFGAKIKNVIKPFKLSA